VFIFYCFHLKLLGVLLYFVTHLWILVVSAFLHALWNSWAKKHSDPDLKISGTLLFASVFAVFSIPFFEGNHFSTVKGVMWSLAAGLAEAGYFFSLGKTFSRSSFGVAYMVMRGTAMVLVWVISVLLLGEEFGLRPLAGSLLVILGLYLTSLQKINSSLKETFNRNFLQQQKWSFVCAVCISCYHIAYGHSLAEGSRPASLFAVSLWLSVILIFSLRSKDYFNRAKAMIRLEWPSLLKSGFICNLSFLFFLVGLSQTGAGTALTLRNTSVIFAQFLAFLMGEAITRWQWAGAVLVASGASLVALGA
jgi:drug/metabolite transporter (DMT)-like permease